MDSRNTAAADSSRDWLLRLFNRSVLKQRKFKEIVALLGPTEGLRCLDIGSDNGVISFLLRQRGGIWKSADLEEATVRSTRELVGADVYQIDGKSLPARTPFESGEFDRVVIVDFLEHVPDDAGFIEEMLRILRPGGRLIVNVPHVKDGMLRRLRLALGQTDEEHGHLRPGYTVADLARLLGSRFHVQAYRTYSKSFSEFLDTLIVFAVSRLQRKKKARSQKGLVVTGKDLGAYQSMFRLYSLLYPVVWLFARLDGLLFASSGYMLILSAQAEEKASCQAAAMATP